MNVLFGVTENHIVLTRLSLFIFTIFSLSNFVKSQRIQWDTLGPSTLLFQITGLPSNNQISEIHMMCNDVM